ncbi:MAG: tetratricopeptide repeat protein [Thermomicrobiales bacterium]
MGQGTELPDFDRQWDYDRPDATEQIFRDLLSAAGDAADASWRLELLTQIARAQGLQRRFADAHATLDAVEPALPEQPPRVRMRYLLERGRVFTSSGEPEAAVPLFSEAWQLGCAHGEDHLAVDATHMLGIAAPAVERLAWNERALALAERSDQPGARRWIGSLLNNIGWTYHDLGRYDNALALFTRAVDWREREGKPNDIRIAHWCVARTLRSLGRVPEALALQQNLRDQLGATGARDGYVDEEIAECLLLLGRNEEARTHAGAAHATLSTDPWLVANEPARLQRLQALGDGRFSKI